MSRRAVKIRALRVGGIYIVPYKYAEKIL